MGLLKRRSADEELTKWIQSHGEVYKNISVLEIYGLARGESEDDWLVPSICAGTAWPAHEYPIPEFSERLWSSDPDLAESTSFRFESVQKRLVAKGGVDERAALLAVAQVRALALPRAVEEVLGNAARAARDLIQQDSVAAELMLADEPIYPSAVRLFWQKIVDDGFNWATATPDQRKQARAESAWSLIPDLAPWDLGRLGPEERLPPTDAKYLRAVMQILCGEPTDIPFEVDPRNSFLRAADIAGSLADEEEIPPTG